MYLHIFLRLKVTLFVRLVIKSIELCWNVSPYYNYNKINLFKTSLTKQNKTVFQCSSIIYYSGKYFRQYFAPLGALALGSNGLRMLTRVRIGLMV